MNALELKVPPPLVTLIAGALAVGLLLVLVPWAIFLVSPWSLFGPVLLCSEGAAMALAQKLSSIRVPTR